jgi:membrane fusion protein, multidrug efflux system
MNSDIEKPNPEPAAPKPQDSDSKAAIDNRPRNKKLLRVAAIIVPLLIIALVVYYFIEVRPYESTDDAFVDGHSIQISPKVAGHILKLLVTDNQHVKKGDLILQIDPRDFQTQLVSAQASVAAAQSRSAQAKSQLIVSQAQAEQDRAAVGSAEAEATRAKTDLTRYQSVESRAISQQQLDTVVATAQSSAAALEVARKKADASEAQVGLAKAQIVTADADVQQADASVSQAELDLSYADIAAPEDGWITHRTAENGQYVQVGQGLLAVVTGHEWVTANFKETQITLMKPGQPVRIKIDAFPHRKFRGHVDSLQAGTGAIFSLLPPENAAGNYVKVVQRVPVKIMFDDGEYPDSPLPLGASAVPTVKVR